MRGVCGVEEMWVRSVIPVKFSSKRDISKCRGIVG